MKIIVLLTLESICCLVFLIRAMVKCKYDVDKGSLKKVNKCVNYLFIFRFVIFIFIYLVASSYEGNICFCRSRYKFY